MTARGDRSCFERVGRSSLPTAQMCGLPSLLVIALLLFAAGDEDNVVRIKLKLNGAEETLELRPDREEPFGTTVRFCRQHACHRPACRGIGSDIVGRCGGHRRSGGAANQVDGIVW